MTASAVKPAGTRSPRHGSRTRWNAFMTGCFLRGNAGASTLFAERVLIPSVAPSLDLSPRLSGKKPVYFAQGKHTSASRFAIAVSKMSQSGQQPHGKERD